MELEHVHVSFVWNKMTCVCIMFLPVTAVLKDSSRKIWRQFCGVISIEPRQMDETS